MAGQVIARVLRVALAGTFLYAGALKIWDFTRGQPATPDFALAIQQYRLLPSPDLTVLLAVYLPWLEIVAALGLFVRRVQFGAAAVFAAMTTIFIAALSSAMMRGLRLECACFGRDQATTDIPSLLVRDACILAATFYLLLRESGALAPSADPSKASR